MATLLHTKTVTDTAAVLEAVEHVFFKKVSDELEAEHRKGAVCFIHPVICAMASEQFQTLSGSVLTPGIAAVGGEYQLMLHCTRPWLLVLLIQRPMKTQLGNIQRLSSG